MGRLGSLLNFFGVIPRQCSKSAAGAPNVIVRVLTVTSFPRGGTKTAEISPSAEQVPETSLCANQFLVNCDGSRAAGGTNSWSLPRPEDHVAVYSSEKSTDGCRDVASEESDRRSKGTTVGFPVESTGISLGHELCGTGASAGKPSVNRSVCTASGSGGCDVAPGKPGSDAVPVLPCAGDESSSEGSCSAGAGSGKPAVGARCSPLSRDHKIGRAHV